MREFNRQIALAEVTKAKAEQDARESAARAKRDVLAETKTAPTKNKPAPKEEKEAKPSDIEKKDRVAESGRAGLEGRAKTLEEAIEGGIQQANADNRKKK